MKKLNILVYLSLLFSVSAQAMESLSIEELLRQDIVLHAFILDISKEQQAKQQKLTKLQHKKTEMLVSETAIHDLGRAQFNGHIKKLGEKIEVLKADIDVLDDKVWQLHFYSEQTKKYLAQALKDQAQENAVIEDVGPSTTIEPKVIIEEDAVEEEYESLVSPSDAQYLIGNHHHANPALQAKKHVGLIIGTITSIPLIIGALVSGNFILKKKNMIARAA